MTLLKNYLKNRKQFVHIDEATPSNVLEITCGVPQGSILGPLLFLIHINDLYRASNLMTIMFADDTNLFLSNRNINHLFHDMNIELKKISDWFKSNKLSLNIEKTKYILFHPVSKKNVLPCKMPVLILDNIPIKRITYTNFLGIIIDENLLWKYHIDNLCQKISKSIGILYKSRMRNTLIKLYYSLIHCHISYGNVAWGSTHKSKLKPLHCQQKHVARLINLKDRFTHAKPLLFNMNILNIYEVNIFNVLCFMFKCKINLCPVSFSDLYSCKEKNKYILRNNNFIRQPKCKTNIGKSCIPFRGAFLWNKIVLKNFDFTHEWSYPVFKKKLKEIIFKIDDIFLYF